MSGREKKLEKLLAVHGQLKSFHETRRAGFLAGAAEADADAEALAARFDAADGMGALFPELYHARIAAAVRRAGEQRGGAKAEAEKLAQITLREKAIREALVQTRRQAERTEGERALLDWVETRGGAGGLPG